MKKIVPFIISLFFFAYFTNPAQAKAPDTKPPVTYETVEQGEISYYRYVDDIFTGADMLIRDKKSWETFWTLHTAGRSPQPPAPEINFGREMVIVTILGWQSSGGGPSTRVLEVNIDDHKCLHVLILDNKTPGPLTVITNPFHIIKLNKLNDHSIVFEHQSSH